MSTTAKQVSLTRPQKRPSWMRNFSHPRGVVGSLVGHLMAYKNAPLNRVVAELHDAGFEDVRTERVTAGRELVAVIGRRPAAG